MEKEGIGREERLQGLGVNVVVLELEGEGGYEGVREGGVLDLLRDLGGKSLEHKQYEHNALVNIIFTKNVFF